MPVKSKPHDIDKIGLAIWFLPTLTLSIFSSELPLPDIIGSIVLAVIGGMIGLSLYWLTKEKQRKTKLLTLTALVVSLIALGVFSLNRTESDRADLINCKVCGYIALVSEGEECKVCMTEINEEYRIIEDYESFDELIKEEQLDFFTSDAYGEKRSLYLPEVTVSIVDGKKYAKDENWKPVISEQDLKDELYIDN